MTTFWLSGIAGEALSLGAAEQRLDAARERHQDVAVVLRAQLASIEEVDMVETLTRLQATQTQLEASYRAIASAEELTLARFLR